MAVAAVALAVPLLFGMGGEPAADAGDSATVTTPEPDADGTPAAPALTPTVTLRFDGNQSLPDTADTGQPLGVVDNGRNTTGLGVVDGRLTHGDPTGANAAGYLEAALPGQVQVIGAEAVFSEDSGSIALISWQSSIADARGGATPDPIPNGGIHFVADAESWHLGVWDGVAGTEDILIQRDLGEVRADGVTPYRFEVTRQGDKVWVTTPDGTAGPFTDPRIADWSGPWACWELYEFEPGMNPAAFTNVWAG
jgi:hypothetical protein